MVHSDTSGSKSQETATVDFTALIMGFSSAALYYMGEAPLEGKGAPTKNLALARQNIDIIAMLKDKTRGNLSDDEAKLVEHLLYDVRLKYVEARKRNPKG